jgi:hypothetical protein
VFFPVLCLHRKKLCGLPCHHLTRPLRAGLVVGADVGGLVHVAPAKLAFVLVQVKDMELEGTCPSCSSNQKAG